MQVSAIIPAYNEAANIGRVLSVTVQVKEVDEVIVISDGSTDETAQVAHEFGAKVIELPSNIGKGGAMKVGLDESRGRFILFLDADLIGLTTAHIRDLLEPVMCGEVDMTIGIFSGGRFSTDLAQKITPFLSGQRVVKKEVISRLNDMEVAKFGIEAELTKYVRENNIPYKKITLEHMSHVMKEEKIGWKKGVRARMGMYRDIIKSIAAFKRH